MYVSLKTIQDEKTIKIPGNLLVLAINACFMLAGLMTAPLCMTPLYRSATAPVKNIHN